MQEARRRIAVIKALEKELVRQADQYDSSKTELWEMVGHTVELEEEVSWLRRERYQSDTGRIYAVQDRAD